MRSRPVEELADRMLTCWSDRTVAMSESNRVRSRASTWIATTNEDLAAVGGEALVVSQFTLFADTRKGRRPSFLGAAEPGRAAELVEHLAAQLEAAGVRVGRGVFGAEMTVDLLNDGPFTVLFDTRAS